MKILIVCSGNADNFNFKLNQAFVYEQIEAVKEFYKIQYDIFLIKGRGVIGYLRNISTLRKKVRKYKPDIIHAHFGLSGLVSVFQRKVPVIITFHGSDAAIPKIRFFSRIAAALSHYNIFVSSKIHSKMGLNKRFSIIPCGINLDIFYPVKIEIAKQKLNLNNDKKLILFASGFDNPVKNSSLAFSALNLMNEPAEIIELKDKNREQVNLLLNSSNLLLLTSFSEGSPQVIKEAMACNCPIVATDVGDIKEVIGDTDGCYITSFHPDDVADKIILALNFGKRTNGREKVRHFDNKIVAEKVYKVYKMVIGN